MQGSGVCNNNNNNNDNNRLFVVYFQKFAIKQLIIYIVSMFLRIPQSHY